MNGCINKQIVWVEDEMADTGGLVLFWRLVGQMDGQMDVCMEEVGVAGGRKGVEEGDRVWGKSFQ